MDYRRTINKLTINQLDTAAHDLRNAALVIKHADHFVGASIDRRTGAVCLSGALAFATTSAIATERTHGQPTFRHRMLRSALDAHEYRSDNAHIVLADFIPSALCDVCDVELRAQDRQHHVLACHCCYELEPWERITHYNDTHCTGSELASNMCVLAARHAAELADRKRYMIESLKVPAYA